MNRPPSAASSIAFLLAAITSSGEPKSIVSVVWRFPLRVSLSAIEFFDFREVAIAHRRDFERVDNGEGGFFGHNFNQGFFGAAGMDMSGQAG